MTPWDSQNDSSTFVASIVICEVVSTNTDTFFLGPPLSETQKSLDSVRGGVVNGSNESWSGVPPASTSYHWNGPVPSALIFV